MNQYRKLPKYLVVNDKVLHPLVGGKTLEELYLVYNTYSQKLVYRCIEILSKQDEAKGVQPTIWLFMEAEGINNKDLEDMELEDIEEYYANIRKQSHEIALQMILHLSKQQKLTFILWSTKQKDPFINFAVQSLL